MKYELSLILGFLHEDVPKDLNFGFEKEELGDKRGVAFVVLKYEAAALVERYSELRIERLAALDGAHIMIIGV